MWDHSSGCCPTRRGIQWTYALQAWFDNWLAGRAVDTGPRVEFVMSGGTFAEARTGDRDEVFTSDRGRARPTPLRFIAAGGGQLQAEPPSGENDGGWTGDVGTAASGSLSEQTMRLADLQPGHYRLEVHNRAGPPSNPVALKITFFNPAGEPGPGG